MKIERDARARAYYWQETFKYTLIRAYYYCVYAGEGLRVRNSPDRTPTPRILESVLGFWASSTGEYNKVHVMYDTRVCTYVSCAHMDKRLCLCLRFLFPSSSSSFSSNSSTTTAWYSMLSFFKKVSTEIRVKEEDFMR